MQNSPVELPIEDLLAHSDWVRRLVGGLVFDPARADDAVQETWAAVLERPPRADVDPRAWLAAVARNAVRKLGRGESRRRRRERVAARLEALPDTVDVIAKARLVRRMTDAVLALDEPYRTTLLLRYFEELPPREIATRLGRPVNTVRTHLERGLAKLRGELDAEYGDREAWAFAFLPLCADRTALTTSGSLLLKTGGIVMLCKYVLPAAVVVSLFAAWIGREVEPGATLEVAERDADVLSAEHDVTATIAQPTADVVADSREDLRVAATAVSNAAPLELHRYAGRVVDLAGRSLAGVELLIADPGRPRYREGRFLVGGREFAFRPEELEALRSDPEAVSDRLPGLDDPQDFVRLIAGEDVGVYSVATDGAGRIAVDLAFEGGQWTAADSDNALLSRGNLQVAGGQLEQIFVLAPLAELRGRVTDERGQPVEGVRVMSYLRPGRLPGFPLILEDEEPLRSAWAAETDAAGRFTIARMPIVPGTSVRFDAQRFETRTHTISASDPSELEVELKRLPERERIAGRVIDQEGQPVIHSPIVLDGRESMTDDQGKFHFEVDSLDASSVLLAYQQGFTPAVIEDLAARVERDPESCCELVLQLGAATGSIEGRVVGDGGRGLAGVLVHPVNSQRYPGSMRPLEGRLSSSWEGWAQTDSDGRFVLDGLFHEQYDLVFEGVGRAESVRIDDVPIGSHVLRVVMDRSILISELTGRVLDRRGRGVTGAELCSMVAQFESADSTTYTSRVELGKTGADGAFLLHRVPFGNTKFVVRGSGIEETEFELDPDNALDLTFVVSLRLRFQLDADVAPGATSFEILDEEGTRIRFQAIYTDRDILASTGSLKQRDALPTIEVGDEASEIVFRAGDVEVDRKSLLLQRGEIVRVR